MTARSKTLIAATVAATLLAVFVGLNLSLGNKQVDARLDRRYPVADPQFPRAMGAVLSPALVPGNRVDARFRGVPAEFAALALQAPALQRVPYPYLTQGVKR